MIHSSIVPADLRRFPDNPDCFDPGKSEFQVLVVPISQIIDPLNQTHRPDRVAEYREAMDSGALFPPISVIRFGRRFILTDGHKRLSACKQRRMSHVMVEVWTIKRWLSDLRDQSARKTRQALVLGARSTVDAGSRKASVRLFWDTVGHWKRIFKSAGVLIFGEQINDSAELTDVPAPVNDDAGKEVFWRLVRECANFPGHLALITASLAALGGSQLYLTWLAKLWSEGPLATGDRQAMNRLLARAIVTSGVFVLSLFASRYFLRSLNQHLVQRLRDRAENRLFEVEISSVRRFQAGELMSRLFNDTGVLTEFVREILRRAIGESLVVAGALAMAFYLNWKLALVMSIVGPLVALALSNWGRLIRRRSEHAQREVGKLSAVLSEQLSGLTTIKGFQTESYERQRFAAQDSLYRRHMLRAEFSMAAMTASVWLATCAGLIGVVWYGTNEVFSGGATRAALLAFCLYAVQTIEPVRRLSEVHGLLQRSLAAAARVFEIIDMPLREKDGTSHPRQPVHGELSFANVEFNYGHERQILNRFNLTIGPRETVALVAASGGGKSTIANLLLRFLDPRQGRILLDGLDLRQLRLADLRHLVCVAEQEPFIFSGSVRDNISYGSFEATRQKIEFAAALAGLEEIVRSLPSGLDAYLAEDGRNLSGGQKQRIALARTIVRDPAILVLDEATSALDGETERAIFERMESWLAKRTVIVMSHRLATITRFPRIVVLQDGTIVGDGSASELLHGCAQFRSLFAEQLAPLGDSSMRQPA